MMIPTTIATATMGRTPPENCVDMILVISVGAICAVEVPIGVECIVTNLKETAMAMGVPNCLS